MNRIKIKSAFRIAVCAILITLLLPAACTKQPASGAPASLSGATAASAEHTETDSAASAEISGNGSVAGESDTSPVAEDGSYTSKDEVALYIHTYGKLPSNFITKKEARSRGWDSSKGNLGQVAPGMSIGGDRFGNREGLLPDQKGRQYYECDIDYDGASRNAKRIVFSDDGLIFYTDDHYASFEQLY